MAKRRVGSGLSGPEFKREQLDGIERSVLLDTFGADGMITEVLERLGDGKEATVYRCRAHPSSGERFAAAKVYRAQKFRAFGNASAYRGDRGGRDRRAALAMRKRTNVGRHLLHGDWVDREWETLCRVADAGADVPEPYAKSPDAILMEYVGTEDEPAPLLLRAELSRERAKALFDQLIWNVELFLRCERVHADLSAYNVLITDAGPSIIDLPQAVDTRHPNAHGLLARDVENLCRHFSRHGVAADAGALTRRLWRLQT